MKILTKAIQNRFIKETFAKNRMSKALFVLKKIADGRTDRQFLGLIMLNHAKNHPNYA